MNKVKIKSMGETIGTIVTVGDSHISHVRSVVFEQSAGEVPTFTFETIGLPDINIWNPDIRFKFHPETIEESAKVMRHSFSTDKKLYDSFADSIASVLKEIPADTGLYDVAQAVADRIIGKE